MSKSEMEHRASRSILGKLQVSTCVITLGNTRKTNADSWRGTQLRPSSVSKEPTGQKQLPSDRGLRRHKWEHPVSRQGFKDLGCSTSCIT